jgi:hypothetical protein
MYSLTLMICAEVTEQIKNDKIAITIFFIWS